MFWLEQYSFAFVRTGLANCMSQLSETHTTVKRQERKTFWQIKNDTEETTTFPHLE